MERNPNEPLTSEVAREVAVREGIKAVVDGEINRAGGGYVLSTQLIVPEGGDVVVAFRETASDSTEIIPALDRLSKRLREKFGESLRTVRASRRLSRVTTASLPALRKYSQASRADSAGEYRRAIELLREAVAIDTTFAMAYRFLGIQLSNLRVERRAEFEAMTKAFRYRDRLPEQARLHVEGSYYGSVTHEDRNAVAAYRALLDLNPEHWGARNNLGIQYSRLREFERAEEAFRYVVESGSRFALYHANLIRAQVYLGWIDSAAATLQRISELRPGHPMVVQVAYGLAVVKGDYDGAEAQARQTIERSDLDDTVIASALRVLMRLAVLRGRLTEADRYARELLEVNSRQGLPWEMLATVADVGLSDIEVGRHTADAVANVAAALAQYPLGDMDPLDRPYVRLARFYAGANQPERARALLAEFEREVPAELRRDLEPQRYGALGLVALAEGKASEAIDEFRRSDQGWCTVCALPDLARAYDLHAETDSAIATYERYLSTPSFFGRLVIDWLTLAPTYKRLGELYEQRGERQKAVEYYDRFIGLWEDADPELQPQVRETRERMATLVEER
jgi:tetratricopeptide (TPR) repeat protein